MNDLLSCNLLRLNLLLCIKLRYLFSLLLQFQLLLGIVLVEHVHLFLHFLNLKVLDCGKLLLHLLGLIVLRVLQFFQVLGCHLILLLLHLVFH